MPPPSRKSSGLPQRPLSVSLRARKEKGASTRDPPSCIRSLHLSASPAAYLSCSLPSAGSLGFCFFLFPFRPSGPLLPAASLRCEVGTVVLSPAVRWGGRESERKAKPSRRPWAPSRPRAQSTGEALAALPGHRLHIRQLAQPVHSASTPSPLPWSFFLLPSPGGPHPRPGDPLVPCWAGLGLAWREHNAKDPDLELGLLLALWI